MKSLSSGLIRRFTVRSAALVLVLGASSAAYAQVTFSVDGQHIKRANIIVTSKDSASWSFGQSNPVSRNATAREQGSGMSSGRQTQSATFGERVTPGSTFSLSKVSIQDLHFCAKGGSSKPAKGGISASDDWEKQACRISTAVLDVDGVSYTLTDVVISALIHRDLAARCTAANVAADCDGDGITISFGDMAINEKGTDMTHKG